MRGHRFATADGVAMLPLLVQWTRRDFRVRYAQTALGSAWALIQPIALTAGFVFVFHQVAGIQVGVPYASYVFPGMVLWGLFATGIVSATTSVANAMYVISKVRYPRLVSPISATLLPLVDLGAGLLLFPVLGLVQHAPMRFHPVPFLAAIAGCIAFTTGVGLVLSALVVFVRDVRNVVPLAVQLSLLATPVAYPADRLPGVLRWNPMATFVEAFRSALVRTPGPSGTAWLRAWAATAVIGALGYFYFAAVEDRFPDVA